MDKKSVSHRLSADGRQLIKLLAQHLGANETTVIELAVRALAKQEGIKVEKQQQGERNQD